MSIADYKGSSSRFLKAIAMGNLRDLAKIPFYLVRLVELFKNSGSLPGNKAQVFEELLKARLNHDEQHFKTTIDLHSKRSTIVTVIEHIALGMETLGRNFITSDELEQLLPDESKRTLLNYSTLLKKDVGQNETWQFEHNNFQEYLAARLLSRQSLNIIKIFVSFEPENNRIIPTWVNTLSFLASILDKSEPIFENFINWVRKIEPQLVVKFEPDKVDVSTRIELFKHIFNHYKERKTRIDGDKFPYWQLARLGQSEEVVSFLIEETESDNEYIKTSAIELLGLMDTHYGQEEQLKQLLTRFALENDNPHIRNRALLALANSKLNSEQVINEIVPSLRSSTNDWVRFGIYYLLYNSDYLDENIDVFLEGINYIRFRVSQETRETRLFDEEWYLKSGLEKTTKPEALENILSYFIHNPLDLDEVFLKNDLSHLVDNIVIAYGQKPSIFASALSLLKVLLTKYLEEKAWAFVVFFDKTKTRLRAFKELFTGSSGNQQLLHTLSILADEGCIEFFIEQCEQKNITDQDVWTFQSYLSSVNPHLFSKFNKLINEKYDNKFVIPQKRDYEEERKRALQRDVNLLFDREEFLKEVRHVFDVAQKQSVTSEDLRNLEIQHWTKFTFSQLVFRTLDDLAQHQTISLDSTTKVIEDRDWELFCVGRVYTYFTNHAQITLTPEQRNKITDWCSRNIQMVDFKTALVTDSSGGSGTSWLALYLWFFFRKLSLDYQPSILLDMLSFDWFEDHEMVGIRYLEERSSLGEITKRILQNLKAGIKNENVLKNHIDFCQRYGLREILPVALDVILNSTRREDVRKLALETVMSLPETLGDIEEILPRIKDSFLWHIVDILMVHSPEVCRRFLIEVFRSERGPRKLKAAEYLIQFEDMKALKYYVYYIKRQKRFSHDWLGKSPLLSLRTSDSLPYLIQLLKATYDEGFVQDDFHRLDHIVLSALEAIGLESDEHFGRVKKTVQAFIRKHASRYENVYYLNAFLEKLEDRYYLSKSQNLTITDVLRKLRLLNTEK